MAELEITVNNIGENTAGNLQSILSDFEYQTKSRVIFHLMDWNEAWTEIVKIALYHDGPVVSQVGTTWVSSLISMNAMRPIKPAELTTLGGPECFLPAAMQSAYVPWENQVISIPWVTHTYLLFYRQDILRQAGIDEATAFSSIEQIPQTLATLQASGWKVPWSVTTLKYMNLLHNTAQWVWGRGGDFVSPEKKKAIFNQPAARAGFKDYFELYKYLPPLNRQISESQSAELFSNGQAAVTMADTAILYRLRQHQATAEVTQNLGVAPHPGVPFVGGSNWVIWNHATPAQAQLALEFIRYMNSPQIQLRLHNHLGAFPANMEALKELESDPIKAAFVKSLQTGRSFPHIKGWGLIEDRLVNAIAQIWQKVIFTPNPNIDRLMSDYLETLEGRTNINLKH
jgi:multiple sugar transport system substrate-binding protein